MGLGVGLAMDVGLATDVRAVGVGLAVGVGRRTSVPSVLIRAAVLSDSPNRHVALGLPKPSAARPAAGSVTGMVMLLSQPTAVPDGAAREASMAMTMRTMAGYSPASTLTVSAGERGYPRRVRASNR